MTVDDMILVSVDDHVIEPPGAFKPHWPERLKGREPHIEQRDGRDVWMFEEKAAGYMGLNSVVGRPKEEYGMEPLNYEQMRRGTWDIKARVEDMDANGILGSICFPTFPGFAGARFQTTSRQDPEVALAAIRAYNDWHVHDWAGAAPGRFIPLMLTPFWDMQAAVAEVERMARLGVHALSFSDNPALSGWPSLHDPYWDPLWKACADNQVVICCHIGTGSAGSTRPRPSTSSRWPIFKRAAAAGARRALTWKKTWRPWTVC